jgi:hypothetical protein
MSSSTYTPINLTPSQEETIKKNVESFKEELSRENFNLQNWADRHPLVNKPESISEYKQILPVKEKIRFKIKQKTLYYLKYIYIIYIYI